MTLKISETIDKKSAEEQIAGMELITMAHLGEAQGVIELLRLSRTSPSVFESDAITCIITGEGPFEAASLTANQLGKKTFKRILNLGIAGALDEKLLIGSIHPVRMHYLVIENKPQFKSFSGLNEGIDCLTSFERVLHPDKAKPLKGIAHLIDRESWGVAMVAKQHGIPFESHKLISDYAGTLGACESVKAQVEKWSQALAIHLQTLLKGHLEEKVKSIELEGFYFTFTTSHKFRDLLTKLMIKFEKSSTDLYSQLPLDLIRNESSTPKEKTKKLLHYMENLLDPIKSMVEKRIIDWKDPWEKKGIHLAVDAQWEEKTVKISFEAKSDQELAQKMDELEGLSLNPYQQLLEGHFHVE